MKDTPKVKQLDCTTAVLNDIPIGSREWLDWLALKTSTTFQFQPLEGVNYTVRREKRSTASSDYWYAYKKIQGKLRKLYIGRSNDLTVQNLARIAVELTSEKQAIELEVTQQLLNTKVTQELHNSENTELKLKADKYDLLCEALSKWSKDAEGKTAGKDRTWSYALKMLEELNQVVKDKDQQS